MGKDISTRYDYDDLGRLTDIKENYQAGIPADEQTNVHTVYTYDANGNRLSIQDGNGHVTTFTYDELNHLISETDPLEHSWTYAYDELGNRVSMTDANGNTTAYNYDEASRLSGIDYVGTEFGRLLQLRCREPPYLHDRRGGDHQLGL